MMTQAATALQARQGSVAFPAVAISPLGADALDDQNFTLGIVRLGPDRRVTYVNRAAALMSGGEFKVGMYVGDLPLDDESRNALNDALHQRDEGHGQSYRMRFERRDLGTYVRILNSAVPEYNSAGERIGSIGHIVDESLAFATLAIHKVIANAKECRELLCGLNRELREVLSFDSLTVTGISAQRTHLSRVFEEPLPPPDITPTMWWPMPEFVKAMIDGREVGPLNLTELFATPAWQSYEQKEPAAKQFRERGFKHCLRIGVYRADKLIAMLSVVRTADIPFTAEDTERCRQLPIVEAVNAAMNFEQQRDLKFGSDFVQSISRAADNYEAIAQVVVNQLAAHYGWNHVSLFRLDRQGRNFCLVSQAGRHLTRVPDDYTQDVGTGLLGQAFSEQMPINMGDVTEPRWASRYHPMLPNTLSELVLPVPGTKCRWLLNVESELRFAFADEEQSAVEVPLRIAGFILERVASLDMKTAILRSVADAVIQTNDDDVIVDANPAAEKLFGHSYLELRNRELTQFLTADCDSPDVAPASEPGTVVDPGARALARIADHGEPLPVKLRCADGTSIPVLLSAALLPQRMGGKVFVASDLRAQNRIQRMEVLHNVFQQLVSEIRVPLALSEAFLSDALKRSEGAMVDLIDKTLRQLHAADLPLERIMRLAVRDKDTPLPRLNFDLHDALQRLIAEFPESDAKGIQLHVAEPEIPVQAARHELLFCIRSLLSYLMRRKAQVESVDISLERRGPQAFVCLTLPPMRATPSGFVAAGEAESDFELKLSEPVISNLLERMGGRFEPLGDQHRGFNLQFSAE